MNFMLTNWEQFSDIVIKCRDRKWHLHRVILAARAYHIALILNCHDDEEVKEINTDEFDPDAVGVWLNYIHGRDLENPEHYDLVRVVDLADVAVAINDERFCEHVGSISDRKHLFWTAENIQRNKDGFIDYITIVLRLSQQDNSRIRKELYEDMVTVIASNAELLATDPDVIRLVQETPNLPYHVSLKLALEWRRGALRRDPALAFAKFYKPVGDPIGDQLPVVVAPPAIPREDDAQHNPRRRKHSSSCHDDAGDVVEEAGNDYARAVKRTKIELILWIDSSLRRIERTKPI